MRDCNGRFPFLKLGLQITAYLNSGGKVTGKVLAMGDDAITITGAVDAQATIIPWHALASCSFPWNPDDTAPGVALDLNDAIGDAMQARRDKGE